MHRLFLFILALFCVSCAVIPVKYTTLTGVTDPYYYNQRYSTIIVRAEIEDFVLRKQMEEIVVDVFREQGVTAYADVLFFPPTRNWTKEQIAEVYTKRNIQAVLVLGDFRFGEDSVLVPGSAQTVTKSQSYVDTTRRGKPVEKTNTTVTTTYTDPHIAVSQRFVYSIAMYDVRTQEKAWMGTAETRGPAISREICRDVARALYVGTAEKRVIFVDE